MKERFKEIPQDQDQKFALTIEGLLATPDQNLSVYWQNRTFPFEFPMLAVYLIGSKGRAEFSKDERADLFALNLKAFLSNNNRALTGYSFTKDGKFVTRDNKGSLKTISNNPELVSQNQAIDSATKALFASILLIGMSLLDRERLKSLAIASYQNLSSEGRKVNFTDNLGRLLMQNNATRTWIKENKLDSENGFDWDRELSQLLFFGMYAGQRIERFSIPDEMGYELKHFSLQTRSVMLDYALHYEEKLRRSTNKAKLTDFMKQMGTMEIREDMQEKLDALKIALNYKESKSPADPGSPLRRGTDYIQVGRKNRPN